MIHNLLSCGDLFFQPVSSSINSSVTCGCTCYRLSSRCTLIVAISSQRNTSFTGFYLVIASLQEKSFSLYWLGIFSIENGSHKSCPLCPEQIHVSFYFCRILIQFWYSVGFSALDCSCTLHFLIDYWMVAAGKCSQQVELSGENINITYKPDGSHIAVGNRVR